MPDSLVIVGGGAIGVEFAQIYARFGSRVTVIETASHILPAEDEDAAASIAPALEADGIELLTDASIERATDASEGWELLVGRQVIRAEELLVATGRRPTLADHDLVAAGVEATEDGAPVSTMSCERHPRTSGPPGTSPANFCSRMSPRTRRVSSSRTCSAGTGPATIGWCPGSRSATRRWQASA